MTAPTEQPPRCGKGVCVRMDPGLCDWCEPKLAGWVADLPGLWVRLHLRLAKGQATTGEPVSGGGPAGMPARENVLSFVGPTNPGDRLDLPGDAKERALLATLQVGDVPLLGRLEATVQVVCEHMAVSWPCPPRLPARAPAWPYGPATWAQAEAYRRWRDVTWPHRQAAAIFDFLTRWHRWISGHPWADEYAREVWDLWCRARTLAGEWDPRPEHCAGVCCPRCDTKAIYRYPAEDGRRCDPDAGGCGLWLDDAGYDRWVKLAAHWATTAKAAG